MTGNRDAALARAHLARAEMYSTTDYKKTAAHFRRAVEYHRRGANNQQFGNPLVLAAAPLFTAMAPAVTGALTAVGGLGAGIAAGHLAPYVTGAATRVRDTIWPKNTAGSDYGPKEDAYNPKTAYTGGWGRGSRTDKTDEP